MSTVIQVENLCKSYRLGVIGGGTLRADVSRWLAKLRGRPDPTLQIGQEHHARLRGQEFKALQDVSFEVKQGEILGVIGRNGAGKSTLLKVLSRVTAPTSGEVRVKGRIASLLEVGTGFHPELTGRENIFLNGAILGMTKGEIKTKFDEIVDFSGVEDFIDTPVKRYSSGMYVRLAFAVAAHLEPEILIVDEVLAVGDVEFQKKCMGKIEDVSRGGRTVVFVSHNMDAILRMCSRTMLLKGGNILIDGDTRRAVAEYSAMHATQLPVMDLRSATRTSHARMKAKFTEIKMTSSEINSAWGMAYGRPLGFEVTIESECVLSGLELGISLFTATGSEITSNLSSHAFTLKNTEPGTHVFKAVYAGLRLVPGSYCVQLGLRSEAGFEDFIPKACEFEVLTSELSSKHMTDTFRGVLVPDVSYEFK